MQPRHLLVAAVLSAAATGLLIVQVCIASVIILPFFLFSSIEKTDERLEFVVLSGVQLAGAARPTELLQPSLNVVNIDNARDVRIHSICTRHV
jgi:hypothetical protein